MVLWEGITLGVCLIVFVIVIAVVLIKCPDIRKGLMSIFSKAIDRKINETKKSDKSAGKRK